MSCNRKGWRDRREYFKGKKEDDEEWLPKTGSKAVADHQNPIEQLSKLVTSAVESVSSKEPIVRRRSARVRKNIAAKHYVGPFYKGALDSCDDALDVTGTNTEVIDVDGDQLRLPGIHTEYVNSHTAWSKNCSKYD